MSVTIWIGEEEVGLPSKFVVCFRCNGKGTHVNPAVDGNGLTQEDFDEAGPDFREDYMAGVYDVTCYQCDAKRVLEVPDLQRLTPDQRAAWMKQEEEEAQDRATVEMELRLGA